MRELNKDLYKRAVRFTHLYLIVFLGVLVVGLFPHRLYF